MWHTIIISFFSKSSSVLKTSIFDNVIEGFKSTPGGFSVKKQIAALTVTVMLGLTVYHCINHPKDFILSLSIWTGLITSLLIMGAVEKNNVLKSNKERNN